MDNFEHREPLRPGDIVIYENGCHESNGSLAVVRESGPFGFSEVQTVTVDWISVTGSAGLYRHRTTRWGLEVFRKIGSLSDGSAV